MRTRVIPAGEVRIPELTPGEVVVIERYGKPYVALIDSEDLQLFQNLLAMFGEHQPIELSLTDEELEFHRQSERGDDVEEFDFRLLDTHPPL